MKVWLYTSAAINQLTGKQANPEEDVQVHVWSQGLWIMLTCFGSLIPRPLILSHGHREKWKDQFLTKLPIHENVANIYKTELESNYDQSQSAIMK